MYVIYFILLKQVSHPPTVQNVGKLNEECRIKMKLDHNQFCTLVPQFSLHQTFSVICLTRQKCEKRRKEWRGSSFKFTFCSKFFRENCTFFPSKTVWTLVQRTICRLSPLTTHRLWFTFGIIEPKLVSFYNIFSLFQPFYNYWKGLKFKFFHLEPKILEPKCSNETIMTDHVTILRHCAKQKTILE